jgi:hypothetical protein
LTRADLEQEASYLEGLGVELRITETTDAAAVAEAAVAREGSQRASDGK